MFLKRSTVILLVLVFQFARAWDVPVVGSGCGKSVSGPCVCCDCGDLCRCVASGDSTTPDQPAAPVSGISSKVPAVVAENGRERQQEYRCRHASVRTRPSFTDVPTGPYAGVGLPVAFHSLVV